MGYAHILAERHGDVLVVTLNRPDRLNAAPAAMFDEIRAAIGHLDGARAVLLGGAGRAFCSGADLGSLEGDLATTTYRVLNDHYNPAMQAIAELQVPVVSAVRGAVAGIGLSLALAADLCVASETAYFLQAFVNVGMVPDGGATWMLPRTIGRARALEMFMLGERIPAQQALEWGLINRCVPDDALDAEGFALAERLAAGPTIALGLMRQSLSFALVNDYAAALRNEAEGQRTAGGTVDAVEGSKAFFEKRKPGFTGQ